MTLNHSKTWPVSTLAVVQLRVDANGRTYSTQLDTVLPSSGMEVTHRNGIGANIACGQDRVVDGSCELASSRGTGIQDGHTSNENGVILPLSQQHVELFTRAHQPHPYKTTIRTDTVSTILDQDNDLELEPAVLVNTNGMNEDAYTRRFDKFHVLALARIDECLNETDSRGRRPSVKVDNWDLIYTEREAVRNKLCPACTNRCNESAPTFGGKPRPSNEYNDRLLPDLPLDARKVMTLRRHYYPEGGWGWVIIVCTVLVHILNVGLQLSCSQLVMPGAEKFKTLPVHIAGMLINLPSNSSK